MPNCSPTKPSRLSLPFAQQYTPMMCILPERCRCAHNLHLAFCLRYAFPGTLRLTGKQAMLLTNLRFRGNGQMDVWRTLVASQPYTRALCLCDWDAFCLAPQPPSFYTYFPLLPIAHCWACDLRVWPHKDLEQMHLRPKQQHLQSR